MIRRTVFGKALKEFYDYLVGSDGQSRHPKDAYQKLQQVFTIATKFSDLPGKSMNYTITNSVLIFSSPFIVSAIGVDNTIQSPWLNHDQVWAFFERSLQNYEVFE